MNHEETDLAKEPLLRSLKSNNIVLLLARLPVGQTKLIGRLPMPPSFRTGSWAWIQVCVLPVNFVLFLTKQNHIPLKLCGFQLHKT